MKRLLSSLLALTMVFSMTTSVFAIDTAGGTGDVPVELTQEQTSFSVTVPTVLPVDIDADGVVSVATDNTITNNSYGPVEVRSVSVVPENGWELVDFDTDFAARPVGITEFGFEINNAAVETDGSCPAEFDIIEGLSEIDFTYDATVATQKDALSNVQIASVVFTMGWYDTNSGGTPVTPDDSDPDEPEEEVVVTPSNAPGLYDAYGNMLCSYEGIDFESDYSGDPSADNYYATTVTSPYYYLMVLYPEATQVVMPDDITTIGASSFTNCDRLTTVVVPEGVTTIKKEAFSDCSALEQVTIPATVTSIGDSAFYDCRLLTDIYYGGSESSWTAIDKGSSWDVNTNYTVHYAVEDTPVSYAATFSDNSWEEIIEACETDAVPSTWSVGDTKSMTIDGTEYNIQIIGKDHDTYTSGGTAPLTFQLVEIYTESRMNATNDNTTGWSGSEMRTTTLSTVLSAMPSEVQSAIKAVDKQTLNGAKSGLETTSDKLFLLSEIEVLGSTSYSNGFAEGSRYAFYANGGSAVKTYNGAADCWWLRGPYCNINNSFSYVYSNGNLTSNHANRTGGGVAFGFCF